MTGVVVVGAVNVDLVVAADRLPGPGETVVGPGVQRHGGGKGANAAVAAARAGARVHLVGAVGADDTGRGALVELRAEGVLVDDVAVLEDSPTGMALIVVDARGENQIAVGAGANARVEPERVRASLRAALPGTGCVLVSTEIPDAAVAAAVEEATAAAVPCVLNPAPVIPVVPELLRHGPLLTPNAGELAGLAEAADVGAPVVAAVRAGPGEGRPEPGPPARSVDGVLGRARALADRTGAPVVVTLGAEGVLLATPGGGNAHLPPHPTTVRDTTGAGDTFNGVLAARLAAGDELGRAVHVANVAAALSVARVGARAGMPDAVALGNALAT